jgi:hypothetical protein
VRDVGDSPAVGGPREIADASVAPSGDQLGLVKPESRRTGTAPSSTPVAWIELSIANASVSATTGVGGESGSVAFRGKS